MRKRKIYISGPISGTDDWKERFTRAEKELRVLYSAGGEEIDVINPARIEMPEGTTWQQYMDITLQMLRGCDEIYMLAGWRNSKGAQIERLYALGSGMEITHERRTP
jgi:hypothetical protein